MSTDSTGVLGASTSSQSVGLPPSKSAAAPDAVLANLTWLGKRASIMTKWERDFLFDCTGLIQSQNPLSQKQVAEIKSLRVKYAGK